MNHSMNKVHRITLTAILMAIVFLLAFTPLGYLVIGPIAATTIQMPVIVGAVIMGPAAGATLGFAFGLSAIVKILTMPGADPFATMAINYSPLQYIIVCMASRIAMGWLTGVIAMALKKIPALQGKKSFIGYGITGFVGSMLNTVFYLGLLWLLCAQVVSIHYGVDISGVGDLIMATAVGAGIPEAIVSCIVVTAICRAAQAIFK